MTETTPLYFVEFEKRLEKKFEKIDKRFDAIDKRFDGVDEQLAEVTVRVTNIEEEVKNIKEEIKAANRRADRHSEKIMIGITKLDNHETRIDTLEKQIA
jgi:predicted  nucleic acid-binding Zn-ribbon protein